MIKDVWFSILLVLRSSNLFTKSIWLYDGINISEVDLPFSTVENMPTNLHLLDKQATEQGAEFHFQVGLYANSDSELINLQSHVIKFLSGNLPLYATTGAEPIDSGSTFRCEVTNVAPMEITDVQGITSYHRCYLDLTVYQNYKL